MIEGSAWAKAMSGVSRAWHAEGAGGVAPAACAAGAGGGAGAPAVGAGVTSVRVFGALSERVRDLALPWIDCSCARTRLLGARGPGAAARIDGRDRGSLGGGATRLGFERRRSVNWESIPARVSRISAAMAVIVTSPDITVSIPRRAIKRLVLLATR